jgi:hypothetical protein
VPLSRGRAHIIIKRRKRKKNQQNILINYISIFVELQIHRRVLGGTEAARECTSHKLVKLLLLFVKNSTKGSSKEGGSN